MGVYKCPVCKGRGTVPADFYSHLASTTVVNTCPVACRSCGGKGIVFSYADYCIDTVALINNEKEYLGYYTYGDYLREVGEKNENNKNQK